MERPASIILLQRRPGSRSFPSSPPNIRRIRTSSVSVISASGGARVLATTTLPWPAPSSDKFASIHSDPPWVPTDNPELVEHTFGRGRCIYAASMIENLDTLRPTFDAVVHALCPKHPFEVDAPGSVEASLFDQPDRSRYVLVFGQFSGRAAEHPDLRHPRPAAVTGDRTDHPRSPFGTGAQGRTEGRRRFLYRTATGDAQHVRN